MRILAFSDLHLDAAAAEAVVSAAGAADLVLGAGDFANAHEGLPDLMARLERVAPKAVYVPGNNESAEALRAATTATVIHGQSVARDGIVIAGLGGGVPPLPPMPWQSWDLTEAAAQALLDPLPDADVLLCHSPPKGLGDHHSDLGRIGSDTIKRWVLERQPRLCLFGHVHDCWGETGETGATHWRNLGPEPVWFTL